MKHRQKNQVRANSNKTLNKTHKGEMNATIIAPINCARNEASINELRNHVNNICLGMATNVFCPSRKKKSEELVRLWLQTCNETKEGYTPRNAAISENTGAQRLAANSTQQINYCPERRGIPERTDSFTNKSAG